MTNESQQSGREALEGGGGECKGGGGKWDMQMLKFPDECVSEREGGWGGE